MKKSIDLFTTIAFWTRRLSFSVLISVCLSHLSQVQAQEADIVNAAVNEDRVTIRIKVTGKEGRPVTNLTEDDFKLFVDDQEVFFKYKDWKSSQETIPPPAWIIFLLDMSGSMQEPDSPGSSKTKLEGAIDAIREFTKTTANRGGNTQVAIVPFGEPHSVQCPEGKGGYTIDKEALDKFFPVGDFKLQNYLDYLADLTPCASTNIYEPLTKTIGFLSERRSDPRFYPEEKFQQPQPRLSIILLSDGYHNKPREEEDFQQLLSLLKRNDNIIVHTLGYGLTPRELGDKYGLGREATRRDIGTIPAEEFVDEDRLESISSLTGGISEISGDAQAVGDALTLFLNALLGEYQITYTEPNPIRGSKHNVQVTVESEEIKTGLSNPKPYTITVFGRSLPLEVRLTMLLGIFLVIGIAGVVPFYFWGKSLKQEALRN